MIAYDLSDTALAAARAGGCHVAASLAETGRDVAAVVTMLPAGRHVREVYEGTLFEVVVPGTLLIDCSTIDVAAARTVADGARARGLPFVDAPVSGGIVAARGATLTFMVGGQPEAFAKAEPILPAMGRAVIHAGAAGTGQASKICNNMILGATMIATCEAFLLAQKLGLDPSTFLPDLREGLRSELVDDELLPGAGRRSEDAGRQRPQGRLRRGADVEGSQAGGRRGTGGERVGADGQRRCQPLPGDGQRGRGGTRLLGDAPVPRRMPRGIDSGSIAVGLGHVADAPMNTVANHAEGGLPDPQFGSRRLPVIDALRRMHRGIDSGSIAVGLGHVADAPAGDETLNVGAGSLDAAESLGMPASGSGW